MVLICLFCKSVLSGPVYKRKLVTEMEGQSGLMGERKSIWQWPGRMLWLVML